MKQLRLECTRRTYLDDEEVLWLLPLFLVKKFHGMTHPNFTFWLHDAVLTDISMKVIKGIRNFFGRRF